MHVAPQPGSGAKHTHHSEEKNHPRKTNHSQGGVSGGSIAQPQGLGASHATQRKIAASRSAGGVPHTPLSASRAHPRAWGFGALRSLDSRGFTVTPIVAHDGQQPPKAGNRKIAPIRKCRNRNPETPTNSPRKVAPLIIEIKSENEKKNKGRVFAQRRQDNNESKNT